MNKSVITLVLLSLITLYLTGCAKEDDFNPKLKNSQNVLAYVPSEKADKAILSPTQQKHRFAAYLQHYYSPWTNRHRVFTNEKIKQILLETAKQFMANPGWGENKHPIQASWIKQLVGNMDISAFPNDQQKAITTRAASLRLFPTNIPSYSGINQPGYFYPFDNFQESYVPASMPVRILQVSKDKAWDYVLINATAGWMSANDLALVNKAFVKSWKTNEGYLGVKSDHTALMDANHVFRFKTHMGMIYPIAHETAKNYQIKIAIKNAKDEAVIDFVNIVKTKAIKLPVKFTPENFATIADRFIGGPYGWGGIYGYRDCSATTMNIMSYFGIWLPRNSSQQAALGGRSIDLSKMTDTQKKEMIIAKGVPFATLIHLDGHIMIYIGTKDGHVYVMHDMWGLHTRRFFRADGRAIVGSTIISPISFGRHYLNVTKSLLQSAIGMTVLTEKSQAQKLMEIPKPAVLKKAKQLMVVTTKNWSSQHISRHMKG